MELVSGGSGTSSVYIDTHDVIGYALLAPSERLGTHRPSAFWAFLPAPLLASFVRRRTVQQLLIVDHLII